MQQNASDLICPNGVIALSELAVKRDALLTEVTV